MPICCMCHEDKPESEFAYRRIATGELQDQCRACQAAYRREHYLSNRPLYIAREVARIEGYRLQNRILLRDYLLTHPCVDCAESDVVVLEFDHRETAQKRNAVTYLAARKPWHIVALEIAKCDVRCANCHRIRTALQFAWGVPGRHAYRDRNRALVNNFLREHPCVDCGITNPIVLEFDHRDPTQKEHEIARLIADASWERLKQEIEKCDVRCANCHRRRTARQFGYYRATISEAGFAA